jgi:hypothetical protein
MSILFAVTVIVGAPSWLNFTPVKVAVLLPVASCLSKRMKDLPAVAVGIVKVQLPVNVAVCTVPLVNAIVCDVPVLPMATTLST